MKILIATPAYGAVVHTAYHEAVLQTVSYFQQNFPGIAFESRILSLSMITTARNVFASMVLADPSITHLLFIDADMGFSPSLIARMLAFRKPLTGVVAPQRRMDPEAYHRARALTDNQAIAKLIANDYVAGEGAVIMEQGPDGQQRVEVVDGFVRVRHTGTGIMLIERGVLEALREHYPKLWIAEPPEQVRRVGLKQGGLLQCFEPARDQYGLAMGEDVSFCLRWSTEIGGEIWANIDEPILHVGQDNYAGQYLARLRHSGVTLNMTTTEAS